MKLRIKFRPIKPASPHLNGKVEISQRTDLDEFYSRVDVKYPNLKDILLEWELYYNQHRPHSSLNGKIPNEKVFRIETSDSLAERNRIRSEKRNYHGSRLD
jgi:transposase InsO family protein